MTTSWPEVAIDDIAEEIAMGPFGSDIKTDNFVPSGVPIIRGGNLTRGRFNGDSFVYLTEEKADSLRKANARPGDLVFTHRGTLGQVGLVPSGAQTRYVVSQSQMRLTCKSDVVDPAFLYYFFRSPAGQHELLANTSQTGVPAISRPVTSLKSMRVPLPPLDEQRRIAHILGTLDDKIELNRRMNETLEEMARALFKSWFVDFDPVRAKAEGRDPGLPKHLADLFPGRLVDSALGKIPENWRVARLGDLIATRRGLSYSGAGLSESGVPLHNLNSINEGGGFKRAGMKYYTGDYQDHHLVLAGDVLVANTEQGHERRLIGFAAQVPEDAPSPSIASHHLYVARPREGSGLSREFLCSLLNNITVQDAVSRYANGTTVNMLPSDALKMPHVAVPPAIVLKAFTQFRSLASRQQDQHERDSKTLSQLRDLLLGELFASSAQVAASEGGGLWLGAVQPSH
ncbi:MAG: restriction endonuclease subunit S [Actinobacteria bacterium HGW-Actinobacteria-8]|nr:MAG: restriction endonuclease subunit S [Actinobacteria bacterium HGW-Actinobacteria-8]